MYNLQSEYILIILVSIIISIISLRYSLNLRKYLSELIRVSKKVSKKDFTTKVNINCKGDLGELVGNFNYMVDTINSTIQEVEYTNLQLKSIVKSISHGILAVDIHGNILLINDEAKNISKIDSDKNIEGVHISNCIKEITILEEIKRSIGSTNNEKKQIKTEDDRYYNIKLDPIYLQGSNNAIIGSIINIEDITEKVKLENMRTDFVANVSHELKTPLTSISGFVETLKINEDMDISTRNRFLGIIELESDRLKRLINDILLLSFVESDSIKDTEEVNLYNVFKEAYDLVSISAQSKNIELDYRFSNENIKLQCNKDYIKQIYLNLIDNAIKYTPENGQVKVRVSNNIDSVIIKVKDNGLGIPQEDISRIFERFYRVDKARSQKVGGTGLGLAIVKHMIKSLDGKIEVKSELNKGSEFIVTIPNKNFLE